MPDLFDAGDALGPLEAIMPDKLHPTLREMAIAMYLHLVEDAEAVDALGLERLAELVMGQVDRVSFEVGGSNFYLPRGIGLKVSKVHMEIYAKFNGRNKHLLAREYDLSEMRIYQIVAYCRRVEFAQRQGDLNLDQA